MATHRLAPVLASLLAWALLVTLPAARAEAPRVVGALEVVGSDTLAPLMMAWGEQLERRYPGLRLQLQATGSATVPPALVEGTSRVGAMSRRMTADERAAFVNRYAYPPLAVPVALDSLTVFVHRNNPLEAISLAELDAVFSETRRCAGGGPIRAWGELGLKGRWQERRIALHGRNSASGTYGVFKGEVLCHGDFRPATNEYPGSSAVVAAVADNVTGIGYVGMGYLNAMVKPLALVDNAGRRVPPTPRSVVRGTYPLTRTLYLYVNLPPEERLPALEQVFFDWVLSASGQASVAEAGFVPLAEATLRQARRKLRLDDL
ncbi:PstS family phosphate ABC transporter substrate-binding protein [Modicisalibacter ilicicola]|uniref:PstS family phosphate ABC transporter substrate-binding protein n=1 Tax=Modicisalibacter ilicicola TaxID=480814 RepID=UPI000933C253|nr:phosphate ABC transporter substrate-binding protein [Halomonas ilicicola]